MSTNATSFHDFFEMRALKAAYNIDQWKPYKGDILQYIQELFDEYMDHIGKDWNTACLGDRGLFNECVQAAKTDAQNIGDTVITALRLYFQGSVYEAQRHLFSTLDKIILDQVKRDDDLYERTRLFRIRVSENTAEIRTRKDIFHVPFSHRHQIGSNRFSIPGYPCLYLSSSIYTCWEEMGRPPFHKIVLARFERQQISEFDEQPILYLHKAPMQWREDIENLYQKGDLSSILGRFTTFLRLWPLQLACSIPVRNIGTFFHEEYIMSQMLMQWARFTQKIHGICFRTSHVPQKPKEQIEPTLLVNYAFPARSSAQDYCPELIKQFQLTEPQSFELSLAYERNEKGKNPVFPLDYDRSQRCPFSLSMLSPGYESAYIHSTFCKVERNSMFDECVCVLP